MQGNQVCDFEPRTSNQGPSYAASIWFRSVSWLFLQLGFAPLRHLRFTTLEVEFPRELVQARAILIFRQKMGKSNEGNSISLACKQRREKLPQTQLFTRLSGALQSLALTTTELYQICQPTKQTPQNNSLENSLQHLQIVVDVYQIRHGAMKDFVDPSRPQESRIEKIWPRGRGQDENPLRKALNAIQLSQELIDDSVRHTSTVMASSAKNKEMRGTPRYFSQFSFTKCEKVFVQMRFCYCDKASFLREKH